MATRLPVSCEASFNAINFYCCSSYFLSITFVFAVVVVVDFVDPWAKYFFMCCCRGHCRIKVNSTSDAIVSSLSSNESGNMAPPFPPPSLFQFLNPLSTLLQKEFNFIACKRIIIIIIIIIMVESY